MGPEQSRESRGSQESVTLSLVIVGMAIIIAFNLYRISTLQDQIVSLEEEIRVLVIKTRIK